MSCMTAAQVAMIRARAKRRIRKAGVPVRMDASNAELLVLLKLIKRAAL